MGLLLRLIALVLLLTSPATAQEVVIGTGPICDTQKQIERLIALLDGGAEAAIKSVNTEENDPTACVVATVAFLEGPAVAIARGRDSTYRIIRVLVLGVHTPDGIRATAPAAFFTILKVNEQSV